MERNVKSSAAKSQLKLLAVQSVYDWSRISVIQKEMSLDFEKLFTHKAKNSVEKTKRNKDVSDPNTPTFFNIENEYDLHTKIVVFVKIMTNMQFYLKHWETKYKGA